MSNTPAQLQSEFFAVAEQRFAEFLVKRECISSDEMRKYLERRARGERVERPVLRKINDRTGRAF